MDIEVRKNSGRVFKDLLPGEVFVRDNDVLIKVDAPNEAVNLKNGKVEWFSTEKGVTPVIASVKVEF